MEGPQLVTMKGAQSLDQIGKFLGHLQIEGDLVVMGENVHEAPQ